MTASASPYSLELWVPYPESRRIGCTQCAPVQDMAFKTELQPSADSGISFCASMPVRAIRKLAHELSYVSINRETGSRNSISVFERDGQCFLIQELSPRQLR